jgi:hypothetical protein
LTLFLHRTERMVERGTSPRPFHEPRNMGSMTEARPHPSLSPPGEGETVAASWWNGVLGFKGSMRELFGEFSPHRLRRLRRLRRRGEGETLPASRQGLPRFLFTR